MGMNNLESVPFGFSPILSKPVELPSAIMYFSFFAIGVVTGTILTAGRGGNGSAKSAGKK